MSKVKNFTFSVSRGKFFLGSNEETTSVSFNLLMEDETNFSDSVLFSDESPDWLRGLLEDDLLEGIKQVYKLYHSGTRFDTRGKKREAFKIAFRENLNEIMEIHLRNMLGKTTTKISRKQSEIRALELTDEQIKRDLEWLKDESYELKELDLFPEVTKEGKLDKLKKTLDYYNSQTDKNKEKIKELKEQMAELQ